jgi:hypothetical protein
MSDNFDATRCRTIGFKTARSADAVVWVKVEMWGYYCMLDLLYKELTDEQANTLNKIKCPKIGQGLFELSFVVVSF